MIRKFPHQSQHARSRVEAISGEKEEEFVPFREQLKIVEDLIARHKKDLIEAIDNLHIMEERNSRRAKQIILDDIQKIEDTLDSLEAQRNSLANQLGLQTFSDDQIDEVKAFAAEISKDLETFRQDFEGRRRLIELLDVQVTLKLEGE